MPQKNLRRFFVVGREPEKVTFRFAERNASFNFLGTFRFADYIYIVIFAKTILSGRVDGWTVDAPSDHQYCFHLLITFFCAQKTCANLYKNLCRTCIFLYLLVRQYFTDFFFFPCIYIVRTFASSQGKIEELKIEKLKTEELCKL